MADVTVNIRGDASQLRDELDNVSRNPSSSGSTTPPASGVGGGSAVPSNDRMIEDVRREMQQRGVLLVPGSSSMTQIINQYGQATRGAVNDRISERYDARRDDMRKRMSSDYDAIEADIDKRRQEGLQRLGPNANDTFYTSILDQQLEQERQRQYRIIGSQYDQEEEQINQEEANERTQAETELTAAIRELTDYFNRQSNQGGDTPDSYIGRLREQQKALLRERDAAETEEGAMDASRRLGDVNEQLRRVLSGGDPKQGIPVDSALRGGQGLAGMMSGLSSGDLGGTIMGAGAAYAGLAGMGLKSALKFLGWVGVAATVADGIKKVTMGGSDASEGYAALGSLRSTNPEGWGGEKARQYLTNTVPDRRFFGKSYTDYDLEAEDFASEAYQRSKARGTTSNWYEETFRQIGLEKSLALESGALKGGSQYDRYGVNVTEGVSRLVTLLSGIAGSGVSMNDFTRVQEKYDIQQQLMNSYMNRTDRPDYNVANKMLGAFSSVEGITQDSRIGSDIEAFQSMIQNPMNERMRALIYSSVADLFPEVGGRMDLIDRKINDPENEGKIIQAVVQRVTSMYGGTDTTIGYFAAKALVQSISPDRRDAYWEAFGNPGNLSAEMLSGKVEVPNVQRKSLNNMDFWSQEAVGQLTSVSKTINEWFDWVKTKPAGWFTPMPVTTKSGGQK